MATRKRYGDHVSFLRTFDVVNTMNYTNSEAKRLRCIVGTAPSLSVVANAYGEDVVNTWVTSLCAQIYRACGQDVNPLQIDTLAGVLVAEHSDLKVTDLMLFAVHLLAGHYGHFYRDTDITRLGDMLRAYRQERTAIIAQYLKDEDRRRSERVRQDIRENGISLADYVSTLGKDEGLTPSQKTFLTKFMAQTPADVVAVAKAPDIAETNTEGEKSHENTEADKLQAQEENKAKIKP